MDNYATPDHVQDALSSNRNELNSTDKNKFEWWGSTVSAVAGLILHGMKESADAFPPLKSVVGGL